MTKPIHISRSNWFIDFMRKLLISAILSSSATENSRKNHFSQKTIVYCMKNEMVHRNFLCTTRLNERATQSKCREMEKEFIVSQEEGMKSESDCDLRNAIQLIVSSLYADEWFCGQQHSNSPRMKDSSREPGVLRWWSSSVQTWMCHEKTNSSFESNVPKIDHSNKTLFANWVQITKIVRNAQSHVNYRTSIFRHFNHGFLIHPVFFILNIERQ